MIVDGAVARLKFERDTRPLVECRDPFVAAGIAPLVVAFPILRVGLHWPSRALDIALELRAPDWDYRPPAADWVREDGSPWPLSDAPQGGGFQGAHPRSGRPWLCYRGSLDYHEWEGHVDDHWWAIRDDPQYRLLGFIQNVNSELQRT